MDRERIEQYLRAMGVGEAITNHNAFNVVLDELKTVLGKEEVDFGQSIPQTGTIEKKFYSEKNKGSVGLKVVDNGIMAYYSEKSDMFSPTECSGEFLTIELDGNNCLKINHTIGASKLENGNQNDYVTKYNSAYDVDGVNVNKEVIEDYLQIPSRTFELRGATYYNGIQTQKSHELRITRNGLDVGYVFDNLTKASGYCVLSGEYGYQTMKPMNSGKGDYFWESEAPVVNYELALSKDPKKVADALKEKWLPMKTSADMFGVIEKHSQSR